MIAALLVPAFGGGVGNKFAENRNSYPIGYQSPQQKTVVNITEQNKTGDSPPPPERP